MKITDWFQPPLQFSYFFVWMLYLLVTLLPGFLLWLVTLGSFRYWHLSNKVCEWTVDRHIEKYGID